MKLGRLGQVGAERPVVLADDGRVLDLSGLTADVDATFLRDGLPAVRQAVQAGSSPELEADGQRWGAPVARPGKVVGIGLNYSDHALEAGLALPTEPVVFLKASTSVCGPADEIRPPAGTSKTDWEVELGVVVGRLLRQEADPRRALDCVAGYVTANDVSDRELQLERGGTWTKGKSCDTFCPLGPWLVTADDVPDPQRLQLRLWVNGQLRQDGQTRDMVFAVAHLLSYLSEVMTLEPGDVVLTGTPAGVAMGQAEPRPYLRPGDLVEAEVVGLGRQRTRVVPQGERRTLRVH